MCLYIPTKVTLFIDPISQDSIIRLLKVEFKNSENGPLIGELIFNASDTPDPVTGNISKTISLPLPIKDFVLGASTTGQYWYRITLIKKTDGSGVSSTSLPVVGDWQFNRT